MAGRYEIRFSGAGGQGLILAGVIMAEAYDPQNRRLKEFEVKSVKNDQVQEMEMRNLRTRSRTLLEFDVPNR